jgi:hypothetical protein
VPNVNGMKFPYTESGMKAAKKAKGTMTDQDMSRMINQAQEQQEQPYTGQSSDLDKFINTRGRHSGRG